MKTTLLFLWGFFCFNSYTNAQILFPADVVVKNDAAVRDYLAHHQQVMRVPGLSLKLHFFQRGSASKHYTYNIEYAGLPLLDAFIKVSTNMQGKILSMKIDGLPGFLPDEAEVMSMTASMISKDLLENHVPGVHIRNAYPALDARNEVAAPVWVVECWNKVMDKTYVLDAGAAILEERDHSRYLKTDTLVHARVFNPDPLTVQALSYGNPNIDNNDANLPWFAPAYVNVDVPAYFETASQTFLLENDLVVIEDFQSPNIPVVSSSLPDFFYNRSEGGFEQCNALYHISTYHDHISSLGYDTLMGIPITVDAQGMMGADNSMFNRNGGDPTLSFGTGGVDDAEDADVIIHEYSHALSWSANNNTFSAVQRSGLDEGLADYFATSYSRSINPFGWEKMFSWDGHNEYWGGRTAITANNYPNASTLYEYGEIWNAAMSAIWTDLGQVITDKLMLESMHFFTNTTTLPEAAIYIMQSDTILFNGIHGTTLCNRFKDKNILDANCMPVGLTGQTAKEVAVQLLNTYGFTFRNEAAHVVLNEPSDGHYEIRNMSGGLVTVRSFNFQKWIDIEPGDLARGIYILSIHTGAGSRNFKLIR